MDEEPELQTTPSEQRLDALLEDLITRTCEESLTWEVDDAHPDSYCIAGEGWLLATRSVDGDAQHPFALIISGPTGVAELEIRSTSPHGRRFADRFARLHAAAASSATMAGAAPLLDRVVAGLTASRT